MPHPIKNPFGLTARGGPQIILERPEMAKLLGAIAAEWGSIENIVAWIFETVSLSRPVEGGRTRSQLAQEIVGRLTSFQAKKEMTLAIMRLRCSDDICQEFEQLARKIGKRSKLRNELVHTEWQICADYPHDLIKIKDEKWIRYTQADFSELLRVSTEMRNTSQDSLIKLSHAPMKDIE